MSGETPELESGYGPTAPPGDNLINDFQQETARSYAELAAARGDRCERIEGVVTLTDADTPLPFWNRAVIEQPITDVAATVAAIRKFFDRAGAGPFLVDSAWPTPDLRAYGFILMGHPPLMARAPAPLPTPPSDLRVVETNADTAADMERTLIDGYPAPMMQPFEHVRMFVPGTFQATRWHHFVGYTDGQPVAAGSSYAGDQLVRVENIATMPAARGRGFGAAITAATIGVDASKPAVLVASDLGRPVYEKLGFGAVARVSYWIGPR